MNKIIEYKVLYNKFLQKLQDEIHIFIKNDWQPYGNLFQDYGEDFIQPMVKYEEPKLKVKNFNPQHDPHHHCKNCEKYLRSITLCP